MLKKIIGLSIVLIGISLPSLVPMTIAANSIEGTWGFTDLGVGNKGKYWYTDVGKITINGDGTGTFTYSSNGGGVVTSKTESFT